MLAIYCFFRQCLAAVKHLSLLCTPPRELCLAIVDTVRYGKSHVDNLRNDEQPSFRFIAHALLGSLAKASCRPDGRPYQQSDRLPDIADSIIDLNQISFVFPLKK